MPVTFHLLKWILRLLTTFGKETLFKLDYYEGYNLNFRITKEEAESLLQCYADAIPNSPDLAYQLAYCHLKLGRQQRARSLLHKMLEADPDREDARALLAECGAA